MMDVMNRIKEMGIIPVVVLEDVNDAKPLAEALCEGGLPCAEVTFRTKAAAEALKIMRENHPDMLLGAGTVLTKEQVDLAIESGASFIVSPGLNPNTVKYCQEKGIPMIPGVQTPSEMELAMELGLDTVKFFPAEPAGGLAMIKAVAAAYTNLKFMPTGGINEANVRDYLRYDRIIACGGSWMVKGNLIKEKQFDQIKEMVAGAAKIVKEER
ncbi:MAG: bifunctional 4-hydroxy-2-oxoglutarate aldolase/2-dehydro-3-deoxy-phosphogluconate aldolase [Lachnospiraceae bacterium]|nr:bifunctional 4-hydroxy-2-oxoglutarate aldolase/2-dehydro-3-deoxy-phosphogluconate aldolase [Lachnospiraceae bacterium]